MEIWQRWDLFGILGIQNVIIETSVLHDAYYGVESLGTSQVQDLPMINFPKSRLEGG